MIFIMVTLGGATRLTDSGLSIVEWKPLHGVVPPLDADAWRAEFLRYQQYPEYRKINHGMTLAEFKRIFWWEYAHRFWGRVIGVVFLLPLVWFAANGYLEKRHLPPLAGVFALGGLQGVVGWLMVQSGLQDRPDVSPDRLAVHLGLAMVLYGACYWQGLAFRHGLGGSPDARLCFVAGMIWVTMVVGGLVAGHDAGLVYNTFPLMGDGLMPPDAWFMVPWWRNLLENPSTVQFLHRSCAYALLALTGWAALGHRVYPSPVRRSLTVMYVLLGVQVVLGVFTLLRQAPLVPALLHQANAVLLLTAAVRACYFSRRRL